MPKFKFKEKASKTATMRKSVTIITLLVFSLEIPLSSAWAVQAVKGYTWQDKLKRGAVNIVTSPVEVARDIHVTTEEKNLLVGWTVGLVKGLGEGFLRFGAGQHGSTDGARNECPTFQRSGVAVLLTNNQRTRKDFES